MSDECHLSVVPESAGVAPATRSESGQSPSISLDTGATQETTGESGATPVVNGEAGGDTAPAAADAGRTVVTTRETAVTVAQTIEDSNSTVIGNQPPIGTPADEDSDFDVPEEDSQPPAAGTSPREFLADFDTATHVLSAGASLTKRPDSISLDYLTAYSIGPIADGDVSGGARARVWRVRAVNNEIANNGEVFLARANDSNDGWDAEISLFTYAGSVTEVDLAFEQAARPVVSLEIAGAIWLFWFDPIPADFALDNLTAGRTPRLLLDDLVDSNNSDVLLFYINNNKIQYRQQRDRYATAYDTPVTGVGDNYYLEDTFRTTDNRIAVLFSIRDVAAGRYSLGRLESTFYGFFPPADSLDLVQLIQSGLFELVVIDITAESESLDLSQLIQSGLLVSPIILYTSFDNDALDLSQLIQSGLLAVIVMTYVSFDLDALDLSQLIQSGTLVTVVITYTAFDNDGLDLSQLIQSGTLAP